MTQWETKQPDSPPPTSTFDACDCIHLSVSLNTNTGYRWQYLAMNFGVHSLNSHEHCLATWPVEAIRIAREKLDQLEQQLNEEAQ